MSEALHILKREKQAVTGLLKTAAKKDILCSVGTFNTPCVVYFIYFSQNQQKMC